MTTIAALDLSSRRSGFGWTTDAACNTRMYARAALNAVSAGIEMAERDMQRRRDSSAPEDEQHE